MASSPRDDRNRYECVMPLRGWKTRTVGTDRRKRINRVVEFRLRAAAAAHRVPLNVENIEEHFSLASAIGDEELTQAMPLAIAAVAGVKQSTIGRLIDDAMVLIDDAMVAIERDNQSLKVESARSFCTNLASCNMSRSHSYETFTRCFSVRIRKNAAARHRDKRRV
jgi:hypothetical protein